jgi:hypothetical protein
MMFIARSDLRGQQIDKGRISSTDCYNVFLNVRMAVGIVPDKLTLIDTGK